MSKTWETAGDKLLYKSDAQLRDRANTSFAGQPVYRYGTADCHLVVKCGNSVDGLMTMLPSSSVSIPLSMYKLVLPLPDKNSAMTQPSTTVVMSLPEPTQTQGSHEPIDSQFYSQE